MTIKFLGHDPRGVGWFRWDDKQSNWNGPHDSHRAAELSALNLVVKRVKSSPGEGKEL